MITNSKLHHILIKEIIDNGFAPEISYLADYFNTSENEVEKALLELQEYHGVVLHPNEPKVWIIHPFSLAPANFFINSSKRSMVGKLCLVFTWSRSIIEN